MATVVIAEAGVNHNGDIGMAYQLIDAAAAAGADAVKFQTFAAEDLTTASAAKAEYQVRRDGDGSQREMLSKLQLNDDHFSKLSHYCRQKNIAFLSTAFGKKQLKLLLELKIGAIKVPSGEITHLPLLQSMAKAAKSHNLPVYMSTGMCDLGEVEAALQVFIEAGVERTDITLMHCISAYPAPTDQVNLRAIQTLARSFLCPSGYSDHTMGINAPIVAVTLGATVIEKHITLNRKLPGPDHQASLEPNEFSKMVYSIRETERLLGNGIKCMQICEENTRLVARRSIRAARKICAGSILREEDLLYQRPGDGLSPMQLSSVVGKTSEKDYNVGDLIYS